MSQILVKEPQVKFKFIKPVNFQLVKLILSLYFLPQMDDYSVEHRRKSLLTTPTSREGGAETNDDTGRHGLQSCSFSEPSFAPRALLDPLLGSAKGSSRCAYSQTRGSA